MRLEFNKETKVIDIIENESPGTYFNFYNIAFEKWMTIKHPLDFNGGQK